MTKKVKNFLNIILNGTALGVVAGLIPNAVLRTLFKYFSLFKYLIALNI